MFKNKSVAMQPTFTISKITITHLKFIILLDLRFGYAYCGYRAYAF